MTIAWCRHYVGIPYKPLGRDKSGIDCWGLPILVYRQELDLELPDYSGEYSEQIDVEQIAGIARREIASQRWTKVNEPRPFDICGFRLSQSESHTGIWCAPGQMLHAERMYVKIGRYDQGAWGSRFIGFYRFQRAAT